MRRLRCSIPAPDGPSNGTLHVPDGDGPGRVCWCSRTRRNAGDVRAMGDRLAGMGYVALIPDIYYRAGQWAPFDVATLFTDSRERARLSGLTSVLTNDRIIADADAYADFLLARPEVKGIRDRHHRLLPGRAHVADRSGRARPQDAAAASFHGGRLAVAGDPSSPHLSADRITATVYVAGATDDDSFTTEQAGLLENALTDAGVDHTLEFYRARHGFAVPDNPTYSTEADARHWEALHRLYLAHLQDS